MTTDILRFKALPAPSPVSGKAYYALDDSAFSFEMDYKQSEHRVGPQGSASFSIKTLQLEVDIDTSLCIYTWGYCPVGNWKYSLLAPPTAQAGSLQALSAGPMLRGVSVDIEWMVRPQAWFDPTCGWFCMGNKECVVDAIAVEFASGSLGVVADGRLQSLWIKPENCNAVSELFVLLTSGRR